MSFLVPKTQAAATSAVSGLQLQSSSYGKAIPIVYGTTRIAPNLIWYGDFVATPQQSSAGSAGKGGGGIGGGGGGKGGGGSSGYVYQTAVALGLCEGPVQGVGDAILGVYNAYNRIRVNSCSIDSTVTWTYTSTTWRAANGNNSNRITYVDGLGQSPPSADYACTVSQSANTIFGYISVDFNSTTGSSGLSCQARNSQTTQQTILVTGNWQATLGLNFVQAMESSSGSTTTYISNSLYSLLKMTVDL